MVMQPFDSHDARHSIPDDHYLLNVSLDTIDILFRWKGVLDENTHPF